MMKKLFISVHFVRNFQWWLWLLCNTQLFCEVHCSCHPSVTFTGDYSYCL